MWRNRELLAALLTIVLVTVGYGAAVLFLGIPKASGLVGHSLGIIGFLLMLLTETAYSLRKRAMQQPRGPLRSWLRFHIYTGIVGPYLVLLHTSWSFNGLAGALTILTGVVVASGFVGRYIYTLIPRTADGAVIEARELMGMLEAGRLAYAQAAAHAGPGATDADRRDEREARGRLRALERQMGAIRWARRALATWHTIHIPVGMVLFTMGFMHIVAAVYYATLLR